MHDLDRIDRKLLQLVQENARLPAEKIGAAIGLSPSAVQRRLARLRDSGVITAEIAVLDAKAAGFASR